MRLPHCSAPQYPAPIGPSRFASLIATESPEGCRIGLIGLADDLGVTLNNGRPGAKDGPRAFRAALSRYGVSDPDGFDWPRVFDAGDILPVPFDGPPTLDNPKAIEGLHETHGRVTEAVSAMLDLGLFPIAVGGGHDLTFPFVRSVAKRHAPNALAGVYFDAHLDVRETPGSGMAFRRLIEECGVRDLRCIGVNTLANSREHVEWFRSRGGRIMDETGGIGGMVRKVPAFASFDLDVLDAPHAPGVSAVNPDGMSPGKAAEWCRTLGMDPAIRCFDIMELNPAFDVDGRTARLAAHLFLSFLGGFARRTA